MAKSRLGGKIVLRQTHDRSFRVGPRRSFALSLTPSGIPIGRPAEGQRRKRAASTPQSVYNLQVGQRADFCSHSGSAGKEGRTSMSSLELAAAAKPEDDVWMPLRTAPADRPFVIAQLGQSLDGRIATSSGESRWINHDCALDHLHTLRAHVDAVVVGVGTVLADDPRLSVRRVPGRSPARVVIDPSGKLPATAVCVRGDDAARYVVRSQQGPCPDGVETIVVPRTADRLSPHAIVDALFARGLQRLLIEGGAWTVSSFIAAGAVDRLHLLVAPVIIGSGKNGLSLPPIDRLADALRPTTRVHILADGDVLFDCDLRSPTTRA